MNAGDRWAAIDYGPGDSITIDEMAARAGLPHAGLPVPGQAAMDLTVTAGLYWPAVPEALEPRSRLGIPVAP